jgi:YVTN family beta-propeller protein
MVPTGKPQRPAGVEHRSPVVAMLAAVRTCLTLEYTCRLVSASLESDGLTSFSSKSNVTPMQTNNLRADLSAIVLLLMLNNLPAKSQLNVAESANKAAVGLLLVANKGDHALGVIDPSVGRMLATVAEDGVTGHEVAASPDGKRAFVPIYGNAGVGKTGTDGRLLRVIDLTKRQVVGTVDFGKGVRPHCAIFGPRNSLLYVTTELDNSVTVIDPQALKVIGTIPTGQPESHMLAITHDGRRGYTSNVGPGTVSVLDLEARKLLTVIPVTPRAQRIALSVDDRFAFTADQMKPQLAVIDTATNGVRTWIPLPGIGYGTAPTPDGKWLVIAMPKISQVGVVDLKTMQVTRTFAVPKSPQEVLVRPDGGAAYVSCDASRQVAVIDLKNWKVEKLIDAGRGADGLAWAKAD